MPEANPNQFPSSQVCQYLGRAPRVTPKPKLPARQHEALCPRHSFRTRLIEGGLAMVYGVETRALNQAVKRNRDRFPDDFIFALKREEIMRISQSVISFPELKYSKTVYAFTEQGVAMLPSVFRVPVMRHARLLEDQ